MVAVVPGHQGPGELGHSDKYLSPGIRWLSVGVETHGLKSTKPHHRGKFSKIIKYQERNNTNNK